jgi:hypothetical protein
MIPKNRAQIMKNKITLAGHILFDMGGVGRSRI